MMKKTVVGFALAATFAALLAAWGQSRHTTARPKPASTPAATRAAATRTDALRLNTLGTAYMNQQLFEKALNAFERAAAEDPSLRSARVNRGIALLNLGRVEPARTILEKAVREDPQDPNAWYNLGLLEKNAGNAQRAVEDFRKVIELDAGDADTWYFLGASYAQLKEYAKAIEAFGEALKINPVHASAEFGMSQSLQRSGDTAAARQHLERFQFITQHKLGAAISLAYGEQGKYSLAEASPGAAGKAPAAIAVKFTAVSLVAGGEGGAGERSNGGEPGAGACFLDYDNDGRIDLFLADRGPQGGLALLHNTGGKFEDATRNSGLSPEDFAVGCAAGDYDNDGYPDLAVSFAGGVVLLHNLKNGKFKDVTEAAGIVTGTGNRSAAFIDYDHDGDLDLLVTRHAEESGWAQMFRNNGDGTFKDVTEELGLNELAADDIGVAATDYNNDRAVDMVVPGGGPALLENPREGKFAARKPWDGAMPAAAQGVAVLDFDHDGWMDLAFTHAGPPGITLWRNDHGRKFERAALPDPHWSAGFGAVAFDYDNDGWVDLAAAGENEEGKGEIRLFRNLGADGFRDVSADAGLDRIALKHPRSLVAGDYDNDGATDLAVTQDGAPMLLHNQGGNQNHWLRLALTGLNDNKSAIGTKVEVLSAGNRQKFEVSGSSGYLGQNSPYLMVGLGQAKAAEVVRMLWPSGVLQDEVEIAGLKSQSLTEIDRRGSSCPTLFAWDGTRYRLVGDMLGAGVIGHWVGPGERNVPRPAEYIKLDGGALRLRRGKLSFRFMEPLEEAVYLDRVELVAVDHPKEFEVYPNEYFASNPPYPPFKVVFSGREAPLPAGAWDEHGHNLLPELARGKFVGDFHLLKFAGFAEMHRLELDLGSPYDGGPLWLLAHGEIEYFTATSMYAAAQAGLAPVAPYVEAQDHEGKWVRVMDDMGFPAGGARTMTADLTGKLPRGTRRIRITTNLQIYWDDLRISRTAQDQPQRVTGIAPVSAELRFHGFPLKIENRPPGNVAYVYEKASATGPYTRPAGAYTRYGDVLPLVTEFDDRLAVFGSGDEVALEFDPSGLPALQPGWSRDYFFLANGYEKDMDFYAAGGDRVEPLPFRAMPAYPYPEAPESRQRREDELEFNTRFQSGGEAGSYRFQYAKPR